MCVSNLWGWMCYIFVVCVCMVELSFGGFWSVWLEFVLLLMFSDLDFFILMFFFIFVVILVLLIVFVLFFYCWVLK